MAREFGKAGSSTRMLQERRHIIRLCIGLFTALVIMIMVKIPFFLKLLGLKYSALSGIMIFIFIMVGVEIVLRDFWKENKEIRRLERRAERGAKGEESVARVLSQLPESYEVFHDFPSKYGNIDHIVVSDKGVFIIETKSHRGKVTTDGAQILINGNVPEKNFINQTLRNIFWLKELIREKTGLNLFVKGIIVFPNAYVPVQADVKGVSIVDIKKLKNKIENAQFFNQNKKAVVDLIKGYYSQ